MTEPHLAMRGGQAISGHSDARAAPPGPAADSPALAGTVPDEPFRMRAVLVLRRHWLVLALLAAGVMARAATQIAYHPALIYIDSLKYLYGEWPGADPLGYRVLLKLILTVGDLGTVTVLQHLLGLAAAVALYVVLLRRGVSRWLAALAVAPVLLDAYQLQMEHMIMPDVWFEAMVAAGLAVLLWRPGVSWPAAAAAGLILGSSATVRQVGEVLVVPAVLYLLTAGGGWRHVIGRGAVLVVAFALPILGYSSVSYARTGHFWLAAGQGSAPGRLAAAADCATLKLPAAAAPLCPTPGEQARGPDWLEHSGESPLHTAVIPPGTSRAALISDLRTAVERQQPVRVVASVLHDSLHLFTVTRRGSPGGTPISRWQFQAGYPTYFPQVTVGSGHVIVLGLQRRVYGPFRHRTLSPSYGGPAQVDRPVAAFLRSYQLDGGFTPGPLLALCVLAGLTGSALVLARGARGARSRQLARACLLFTATAAVVLLVPDAFEFSWRYQLPALITLPPAGVLGLSAVFRYRQRDQAGDQIG